MIDLYYNEPADGGANKDWRKNIHKTLKVLADEPNVPQVVIDSIDAAYLQGLEESKSQIQAVIGKLEGERKDVNVPENTMGHRNAFNSGLDTAISLLKQLLSEK